MPVMIVAFKIRNILILVLIFHYCFSAGIDVGKRIMGGKKARIENFYYAIAIEKLAGFKILGVRVGSWSYICGGSIISKEWVITAKQCLDQDNYRIVYGTSYVSLFWESSDNYEHVEDHIKHPDAEICLMKLENELVFGETVNEVFLSGWGSKEFPIPQFGIIAGWGAEGLGIFQLRSLWLKSIIVELNVNYQSSPLKITSMGKKENGGPCRGDQGNGVISQMLLLGVFYESFTNETTEDCTIGLIEPIYPYREWIFDISGVKSEIFGE